MRLSSFLPLGLFCSVDDVQLAALVHIYEVCGVACGADQQIAVVIRILHGFLQDFAGDDVELDLSDAGLAASLNEGNEAVDIFFGSQHLWGKSLVEAVTHSISCLRKFRIGTYHCGGTLSDRIGQCAY